MDKVLQALSRAADGACIVDQKHRINFWNAAAERILGYSAEEVRGLPCYEVFSGRPRPGCVECGNDCPVMLAANCDQNVSPFKLLSHTKDGREIMLNVSIIMPPASASPFTIIHLFRDMTHQMYYETYVEQILRSAVRLPPPQTTLGRGPLRENPPNTPLTDREKEVLYLLAEGKAPRDIAASLSLSYATVRNYVQNLLRKFRVHSQRDLVKVALERRLV
jgi:PAS domain S-box-containing protein